MYRTRVHRKRCIRLDVSGDKAAESFRFAAVATWSPMQLGLGDCLWVHCGGRGGGGATDGRHLKTLDARRGRLSNYPSLPRPTHLPAVDQ